MPDFYITIDYDKARESNYYQQCREKGIAWNYLIDNADSSEVEEVKHLCRALSLLPFDLF
jgi:hypothetical protein